MIRWRTWYRPRRSMTAMALLLVLGACTAVGPDYQTPEAELPDLWQQDLSRGLTEGKADLQTWWSVFEEPKLNELIGRAETGNLALKDAVARVRQARAQFGIASGERFPQVDGVGTTEFGRVSEEVTDSLPEPQSRHDDFYALGLDASWEIDFWGRIRRNVESADANIGATIEDYRDTLVVLYADVAASYVEVRTLQARIASALSNVQTQQGALRLTIDRNQAGLSPDLDVRQAQLNLATTEAVVPALRTALASAVNRLAVLLGEYPSVLRAELEAMAPIPEPPSEVVVGLPAELLRQRPDIRSAERQLASQTAQVGVATADLYPRFSLFGTFAYESFDAGSMFSTDAISYSFGPSFRWNIFNAGRVRSNIDLQDARTESLLVAYEQSVLQGVEEVESAMTAFVEEQERRDALERAVVAARESVRLVDTLYRTGLTDFQNVLDMQRSQFEREDDLAASTGLVAQNLIRLYRALGGGWAAAAEAPPATTGAPTTTTAAPPDPSIRPASAPATPTTVVGATG